MRAVRFCRPSGALVEEGPPVPSDKSLGYSRAVPAGPTACDPAECATAFGPPDSSSFFPPRPLRSSAVSVLICFRSPFRPFTPSPALPVRRLRLRRPAVRDGSAFPSGRCPPTLHLSPLCPLRSSAVSVLIRCRSPFPLFPPSRARLFRRLLLASWRSVRRSRAGRGAERLLRCPFAALRTPNSALSVAPALSRRRYPHNTGCFTRS